MSGDEVVSPPAGEPERVSNRDRVPRRRSPTARSARVSSQPRVAGKAPVSGAGGALTLQQKLASGVPLTPSDLGSGRDIPFEWEMFVGQVFTNVQQVVADVQQVATNVQQIQTVIDNGGGSVTPAPAFVHQQASAAAVWSITHSLGTKPNVLVVDVSGQELLAEVHYPDDQVAVVVHGQPYSGTAYLRA